MSNSFWVEAKRVVGAGDKVPHRCPFHDDRHPSAVTFLHEDNKCYTYCSSCRSGARGKYEIVGGGILVTVTGKRIRPLPSPGSLSTPVVDERSKADQEWYRLISRMVPPVASNKEEVLDFWNNYLIAKGIRNPQEAQHVEAPPIIFDLGVWFPVSVVDNLGNVRFQAQSGYGVVRSIPYKSLNCFPDLSPSACAYIPYPSQLPRYSCVVVFESPIVALRISLLGWRNAVAGLGTGKRLANNLKKQYKVVTVCDPGSPGKVVQADEITDVDKLPDDKIEVLMGMLNISKE